VTPADETSKLSALRRARERLELALAKDDDWQALNNASAAAGRDGGDTVGREAMLLAHPLYRAWKNVTAAIAAQGGGRCDAEPGHLRKPPAGGTGPIFAAELAADGRGGSDRPPMQVLAAQQEEASVSFVARTPPQAPLDPPRPRAEPPRPPWEAGQQPSKHDPSQGLAASRAEEAEVSLVSVDARRHQGAVERLLRALRGA
jgi:hypothetical protein